MVVQAQNGSCCGAKEQTQNVTQNEPARPGKTYVPQVDVWDQPDAVVLVADLPGVTAEELDVQFEDGTLSLHGKVAPRGPQGARGMVQEYGLGDYYRQFQLREPIDEANITAELRDGVLTLRLPKRAATQARKIPVVGNV